jgi:hypothetical protein
MISFQLVRFGFMRCSELEENLTIGSINPSFTKNNKFHYVIASRRFCLLAAKQSPENKALLNVLGIASRRLAMTMRKLSARRIHK